MADVSNTRFSIHEQATAGTLPSGATWLNMNHRFPEGGPNNTTVTDDTITEDQNPATAKLVAGGSALTIPITLQYDGTGPIWQLFRSSIRADASTAATTEVTGVTGTINTLAATGIDTGIEVGDIVRVRNNSNVVLGYHRVTTVAVDNVLIDNDAYDGMSNLKVKRGIRIKNGTTQDTFSMLISNFAPGTTTYNRFELFNHEVMDGFEVSAANQQFMRANFRTIGIGSEGISDTYPGAGSPVFTAAPVTEMMDATNNLPFVYVAGEVIRVQSWSVTWNNNAQPRTFAGSNTADSIAYGVPTTSGSLRYYYNDFAEYNKALAGTLSSFVGVMVDSSGNAFAFSLPSVRYGNPTRQRDGASIFMDLPFTLEKNAGESRAIRIEAFAA